MKPFIPPLKSRAKLLENWFFNKEGGSSYQSNILIELRSLIPWNKGNHKVYEELQAVPFDPATDFVPKGSIVEFQRYHLGQSEERISVKILESPNKVLARKVLMVGAPDFNTLEVEML